MAYRDVKTQLNSRLTQIVGDLPTVAALADAVADEIQELDNAAVDLIVRRLLDTAEGAQLDAWGRVLGERRRGRIDLAYRRALFSRIERNRATGTTDQVIRIARAISDPSLIVSREFGKAYAEIELIDAAGDAGDTSRSVHETRQAGSRVVVIGATGAAFAFGDLNGLELDGDVAGFDDLNSPGDGGVLSTIILND